MIAFQKQQLDFHVEGANQQLNGKLRVLWLANYPLLENHKGHPVCWITALADVIHEEVSLTIISWNSDINSNYTIRKGGITYVYLKAPRGGVDLLTACLLKINRLRNYLKQHSHNFDLIHIHGSENQFLAACAPLNMPKVLSVQGIISEYYKVIPEAISYRRFYWLLAGYYERHYCRRLFHFMCRTHWDTGWVNNLNPKASVHQIWEIIRPEFFEVNDDFSRQTHILYVGGIQSLKGFSELLKALDLVKTEQPDIKLIILGKKPKSISQVEGMIKKFHLKNVSINDLDFRGMQDADGLIKSYQESFCLVHPSYIDNSPNSVCEAQIAGLPVVATNVGGVSSLIDHNNTGLLTTLDPDNIALQILRLKSVSGLAKSISKQSRTVARERHNTQRIKKEVLSTYQSIYSYYLADFTE